MGGSFTSLSRRNFFYGGVCFVVMDSKSMSASNILSIDIALKGDWKGLENQSKRIIDMSRSCCLRNITIKSDRQPASIIVENGSSSNPAIWLHQEPRSAAWIRLNAFPSAWCQLAYQFGHELGHVLANSWSTDSKPQPPSQWIEEALAESLSLFGLSRLAVDWRKFAPFPNNEAYSEEIQRYLSSVLSDYKKIGLKLDVNHTSDWYHREEEKLENDNGLYSREQAFASVLFPFITRNNSLIEDYAALNRWPERTALPNKEYLSHWSASCKEIGTPGLLPKLIIRLLQISYN